MIPFDLDQINNNNIVRMSVRMKATAIMVTEAVGWTLGIPGALCGAIGSETLTLADSVRFFSFLFFLSSAYEKRVAEMDAHLLIHYYYY